MIEKHYHNQTCPFCNRRKLSLTYEIEGEKVVYFYFVCGNCAKYGFFKPEDATLLKEVAECLLKRRSGSV